MIQAGIIGASGYTGSELVRLLEMHPEVEIAAITSESHAGKKFSDLHPAYTDLVDHTLITSAQVKDVELDVVFLALPHGVSMRFVEQFQERKIPIIDLSGDFRLSSPAVYEQWYKKDHSYPKGFENAVYGLPELNKAAISEAQLVANPGCYPTTCALALLPLAEEGKLKGQRIIIDAKSGVTGAGVKPKVTTHFANVNDNFKAYGLKNHRHTVEIEETLNSSSSSKLKVQFTPHLLPIDRGILATAYTTSEVISDDELQEMYHATYYNHPFVRVVESAPEIKDVRGSNYCNVFPTYDERTGNIIVISVIDNLMKGAAGQAVQNMNLMLGFEETAGLKAFPLKP